MAVQCLGFHSVWLPRRPPGGPRPRHGSPWRPQVVWIAMASALCGIDTHGHTGRVEETMRQMQEHRGVLALFGLADGNGPLQPARLIMCLKYEA